MSECIVVLFRVKRIAAGRVVLQEHVAREVIKYKYLTWDNLRYYWHQNYIPNAVFVRAAEKYHGRGADALDVIFGDFEHLASSP